jgi:hypothetical protein
MPQQQQPTIRELRDQLATLVLSRQAQARKVRREQEILEEFEEQIEKLIDKILVQSPSK